MKNEWINNVFRRNDRLSRDDIREYGRTSDQAKRNLIEQRSMNSEFDRDALEGWESLNYDMRVMRGLDKKFIGNSFNIYLFSLIGIAGVTIGLLYFFNWTDTNPPDSSQDSLIKTSVLHENQEIRIDESDISLPQEIESMSEAPHKDQIKVAAIKDDFKEIKSNSEEGHQVILQPLPINDLTEPVKEEKKSIERKHFLAKEVYLSDLKLVDYREYRSKPVIVTKQMILTGLPANKEDEFSEDPEPEWRDLEIAYMDFINKTMRIFNKGDYKKALARFETILSTYKDDVNAHFYGGLCLYNLKEYNKALSFFESCMNSTYSNFDEEAQWMIALCTEKTGNLELAKEYFEIISKQKGFYAGQANEKLK